MKARYTVLIGITLIAILVLFHGVLAAESYEYISQWGSYGSGNGQFDGPGGKQWILPVLSMLSIVVIGGFRSLLRMDIMQANGDPAMQAMDLIRPLALQ
jgi:hypothetical protein